MSVYGQRDAEGDSFVTRFLVSIELRTTFHGLTPFPVQSKSRFFSFSLPPLHLLLKTHFTLCSNRSLSLCLDPLHLLLKTHYNQFLNLMLFCLIVSSVWKRATLRFQISVRLGADLLQSSVWGIQSSPTSSLNTGMNTDSDSNTERERDDRTIMNTHRYTDVCDERHRETLNGLRHSGQTDRRPDAHCRTYIVNWYHIIQR